MSHHVSIVINNQFVADIAMLFGEDQARYLVACTEDGAKSLETAALTTGIEVTRVGLFGGNRVVLGSEAAPLTELSALYRGAFAKAVG